MRIERFRRTQHVMQKSVDPVGAVVVAPSITVGRHIRKQRAVAIFLDNRVDVKRTGCGGSVEQSGSMYSS